MGIPDISGEEFSAFDLSRVKLKNLIYFRMMGNYYINVNSDGSRPYNRSNSRFVYNSELCGILRIAGEEGYSGPIDVYDFIKKICN